MSLDIADNIPSTLIDVLRMRALYQPTQRAFTFLVNGEVEGITVTYEELDRQARVIGSFLQDIANVGDRALLLYQPGSEYIAAFLGCLYAGVVAIPAYPPQSARPERTLARRLRTIAIDCQASIVLTQASFLPVFQKLAKQITELENIASIATDTLPVGSGESWQEPEVTDQSLAFLQYTSGSTSDPKGVMLTHRNLLHNSSLIQRRFAHTPASKGVIWLPPYHDMGLIGGIIQPIYVGFPVTLMSPVAFLQRPLRWLEAISREQATTSGGPNFAYDLCVSKSTPEQRAELDLHSWKVAFSGAEPVRAESMARFAEAFASSGFRKNAFYPCYGLAEATLIVTGGNVDSFPRVGSFDHEALQLNHAVAVPDSTQSAALLVSNGQATDEQQLVIVDITTGSACLPDQVGEIWISGPSIAQGYWRKSEATEATFQAKLPSFPTQTFLRTGDLGFISQHELFITGRLKDLILIRGRNHYPQDIEFTVEDSYPGLRANCGAAFSIDIDGTEQLVIVYEVERHEQHLEVAQVAATIRQAVAQNHNLQVYDIVFIKTGTILKTSSGKIQRIACRAKYLSGQLENIGQSRQEKIEALVASKPTILTPDVVLGVPLEEGITLLTTYIIDLLHAFIQPVPDLLLSEHSLTSLGLDSLAAIELQYKIENDLNINLSPAVFLDDQSVAQLIHSLYEKLSSIGINPPPTEIVVASTPRNFFPLSYGQRALWFLQQLDLKNTANNIFSTMRIYGNVDLDALMQAFQILSERHLALRTTFVVKDGVPYQYIHPHIENSLQVENIAAWDHTTLQNQLRKELKHSFHLEQGPLFHVRLFQHSLTESVLFLAIHHLIADFWSLAILLQELDALYQSEKAHKPVSLTPVDGQYAEFVHWQEQVLASAHGQQMKQYWHHQLAGELPVLNLPCDYPRPTIQTYNGSAYSFLLTEELTQQLKLVAKASGLTLYMVLLACWQILLYRYTGQNDILVGSPLAGRNSKKWSNIIGYFVNPVVLRAYITEDTSVEEFFVQVRRTVLDALAHQDYPFPLLVEHLQSDRDPGHSPLFQTMFVLEKSHLHDQNNLSLSMANPHALPLQLGDLQAEILPVEQLTSQFDISLTMEETGGVLAASLQYNTDLFASTTIVQISRHLQIILEAISQNKEMKIAQSPLLSKEEQQQFAVWNSTRQMFPTQQALHTQFQQHVEQTPQAPALIVGEQHLTYAELNQRANRLAHLLQAQGVGPERCVAICLERSADLLIAILATLKAGGAYVPLDPQYPADRLAFMLKDAQPQVLVTQRTLLAQLSTADLVQEPLCLDALEEQLARMPVHNVNIVPDAAHLAYLIYTSGSTGQPKGVAITHGNAVAFIAWATSFFTRAQLAGVLASTSVCFDLSIFELFVPLSCGGTVILAENVLQLPSLPAAAQVTLLNTVPSAVRELLRLGPLPAGVQTVNLAGEPLPLLLVHQLYQQAGVQAVYNLYGPSEDTTYSTMALMAADEERTPVIGRPISNGQVYLLDGQGQQVPRGVVGELYLGGAGLARGYFGRAALTAERFAPHPFSKEPGARLYRTGDLARFRSDGALEFLGRSDFQVKVRGFRIELGEIEAVLQAHPQVQGGAVIVRPGSTELEQQIVAYVVPESVSTDPSVESRQIVILRNWLQDRLPGYMLPNAYVLLASLPLTPNGKIDRHMLLTSHVTDVFHGDTQLVLPRNPLEDLLLDIWVEVLGHQIISIYDNFFEVGGHSLLATQVIARIRDMYQIDIPLSVLFEAKTIEQLARRVQEYTYGTTVSQVLPLIATVRNTKENPLSFAQKRLWLLQQIDNESPAYNIPAVVKLHGQVDMFAIRKSLEEIVRRHATMRATFIQENGEPVQVIADQIVLTVSQCDLRYLPEEDRNQEAFMALVEECRKPFDLTCGPLFRVFTVQLADDEIVVAITMHHIIADGWSLGILIRELTSLYTTFTQDILSSPLLPLPIQYIDFVHWQREWFNGEIKERQITYWMRQLANAAPLIELPLDYPRPSIQTFNGATQAFSLSADLVTALRDLSKQENVTLYMTLLAAFQILLYRYSGQQDILIGSPIANRTQKQTENLIGLFVNTLVMRMELEDSISFSGLLKRVRTMTLEAYAHQDLPFEQLMEVLQPERSLSYSPIFQVLFTLQNTPELELHLDNLSIERIDIDTGTAKFDLNMTIEEHTDILQGWLEYNTDLFAATTIQRLITHFHLLLQAVLLDKHMSIAKLPLLSKEEQEQFAAWNATQQIYPTQQALHIQFQQQVEQTPLATALIMGEQQLTYAELNQRANRLAHLLQVQGVGPERCVAICLERSADLLIAILATLKAGGAYVPLDPLYPSDRLALMLEDAHPQVVLTQHTLLALLPTKDLLQEPLCMDALEEQLACMPVHNVHIVLEEAHLAYLIYTSGSTGRPKGVAITHGNAVAFTAWALRFFSRAQLAGVLASTSVCFDMSIFEIFATLSCGGTVILAENVLQLPSLPAVAQVTLINTVPSAASELLRLGPLPAGVQTVNLGGEPLPLMLVRQLYQQKTVHAVYNFYGPSEDTTFSTVALMAADEERTPVIGRPIDNGQVYLLDNQGQRVPQGVFGEVYLGGAGLARGYLGRAVLTAERFVPHPFSEEPGARLYRTGDLARFRDDGALEFLGRSDFQVKVRGFRIELGEIETVLQAHPLVQSGVVLVRPGSTELEQQIVAYVVLEPSSMESPAESGQIVALRSWLQARLPGYMLPNAYIVLETLPLTSSGKIDRRKLPAPEIGRLDLSSDLVAPRTVLEQQLVTIWQELLPVEQVGIDDNFFEAGGHSLLATQLVSRLRAHLQMDIPLRTIFEAPTISLLAARLTMFVPAVNTAPALLSISREKNLQLSFAQQRLWILEQLEMYSALYSIPTAVSIEGVLSLETLQQALTLLVARHESLRTTFHLVNTQPMQHIGPPFTVEVPLTDLMQLSSEQQTQRVQQTLEQEYNQGFDLERGPLLRVQALQLNSMRYLLVLNMHHIISDGWSISVFVRELVTTYRAFQTGGVPQLPSLQIQYADYAYWQRQWLQGKALEEQLAYWQNQLQEPLPQLELPTDHPRPITQSFAGAQQRMCLTPQLTQNLYQLSQQEGVSLFMTLLAAFQVLLARYSGQTDVIVGTPIANRTQIQTEHLIGCFINTVALRVDLSISPTFRELLQQVREVTLGAYAHQDLPFERLVEEIQTQRDLSRNPIFQVMFILQNTPEIDLSIPGLTMQTVPIDTGTAKFDLTLMLEEKEDGLQGWFEYNTDLFMATTIARMSQHFQTLLASICAHPEMPIVQLPLLSKEEQQQFAIWNATRQGYSSQQALHTQFQQHVEQTPQAPALIVGEQHLTYAELNQRANRLAHLLQAQGVGPERCVAICLERSADLLIAILATLKAGGAYVPLDPQYPADRLAFMLKDAQPQVLVTQRTLLAQLSTADLLHAPLCLDALEEQLARMPAHNVNILPDAAHLAYLIYTSGSTGQPKGVAITHGNAVAFIAWATSFFTRAQLAGVLASTSVCFDLSIFELFAPLSSGGTVILAENVLQLPSLPATAQVTLLNTVPSAVSELLRLGPLPAGVQTVNLAGEPLPLLLVRQLYQQAGVQAVYNLYGPSEDTTYSTMALIAVDEEHAPVIGRPISNGQVYLLDGQGQQVPQGVVGELYLGGAGLARGYFGRAALTAERFVPHPFSEEPGARLYRTGDLARFRSDGALEFLGRSDFQVKVRGFRIELGEIEHAISQHAAVHDAIVDVYKDRAGISILIAYIVPKTSVLPTSEALRQQLLQTLPAYMIPSFFQFLDALPLTVNGKVDRRLLPRPEEDRTNQLPTFIAPKTPLEEIVAGLWREVLQVNRVGIDDNFFAVGGTSLHLIQILSRLRQVFQTEAPLQKIMQAATIQKMAELLI